MPLAMFDRASNQSRIFDVIKLIVHSYGDNSEQLHFISRLISVMLVCVVFGLKKSAEVVLGKSLLLAVGSASLSLSFESCFVFVI